MPGTNQEAGDLGWNYSYISFEHWLAIDSYSPVAWTPWYLIFLDAGRTFKALREFKLEKPTTPFKTDENLSRLEGLQVNLPACRELTLYGYSVDHLPLFSCANVQILRLRYIYASIDVAILKPFLSNCPSLKNLEVRFPEELELDLLDLLIQFVFCDAREQGVWRDIMSVEVKVSFKGSSSEGESFVNRMVGDQRDFDKLWKEFTVTKDDLGMMVTVRASM
jgi:hypothetical protein